MDNIKAVFIDIDNTLLDFNKCALWSMQKAFNDYGLSFENSMFDTFNIINNRLWLRIEKGELTKEELYACRWNMIFALIRIDVDGVEFENVFYSYLTESAEPVDGALDLLKYLHGKYLVCAASNASYAQQIKRLNNAGMTEYLDRIFISEQIGFSKPQKEFFERCFEKISPIVPPETVMIGDSLTADIEGGASFGMKTCWYNHNLTNESSDLPDFTVCSLSEIKKYL